MSAVLTIGGTTINRVTTRTTLIRCRPYAKDAYPTLAFARCIGTLTPGPDPWDGQPVTLTQDGTLIFAGDTGTHLTHYDAHLGWVREWTCYGLAKRAEYRRSRGSHSRATPTISCRSTLRGISASLIPGPSPATSRW